MNFSIRVRGVEAAQKKLKEFSLEKEFVAALGASALLVHTEAVKSIQEHRSRGVAYRRRGVVHIASKPGSPPNTDTGKLVRSIKFEIDERELRARVGTDLDYGRDLEVKRDRAWLQPAYLKRKAEIKRLFGAIRARKR